MKTYHKIINGDSRQMSELTDSSVHLIITSPPYWQLKDYGAKNQIGFDDSYEQYINNLNLVWKECYRVLYPGCRLCVNIGDQFARSVYYGRYKVIPIREEIIKFCENVGFDYMGAVIWQKVTTSNTTGGGVQMGSYPYPRNGILKLDYEFILILKKLGDAPKPTKEQKELSKMTAEEWNTFFTGHWNFAGVKQDNHLAMFPEELPRRLIKMFSFVGDTILDPFTGSGTTNLAARNLNRNSIGYEINPEFIPVIREKLNANQTDIHGTSFAFDEQKFTSVDFEKEVKLLPYIFSDPHKLDKKVDPKKLQFGSKIDKNGSIKRMDLYKVKRIISINRLILENDLEIKLLGIIPYPERYKFLGEYVNHEGCKFLQEKFNGNKIFLKFDELKYDEEENLLCYLYLENKTFINAHILKNGFAMVDDKTNYRLKSKFKKLYQNRSDVIQKELKNYRFV
ncbi:MAG: DNA methylase N-4 [Ignavibacteria bacterium GWA2_35_9]|nr:MAG: DNA methylase N-4 [Ignavibacteria bacterium GWA2_35_9]OGU46139.1 MAG: DNA methylase N-4 [Ignavibacteria bacterium GWB2_36_8]